MLLKIVTPERVVVEAEVDAFYGKTLDGMIGIKPRHIPLVTPLDIGVMSYSINGQKYPLAVMGGMLSTDGKSVTVLSDAAELTGEIDAIRAKQAKERAEAELRKLDDKHTNAVAQKALTRALTRLKLVSAK
ncbi:ATP synthase F1 subunit epsilon [Vampirovibrio sp.]|uniref:ATP synthase F1 subunit epsilon n=1 Tax=Vampirovibrio sp. TaxID=2717857 RepID=UPI003593E9F1